MLYLTAMRSHWILYDVLETKEADNKNIHNSYYSISSSFSPSNRFSVYVSDCVMRWSATCKLLLIPVTRNDLRTNGDFAWSRQTTGASWMVRTTRSTVNHQSFMNPGFFLKTDRHNDIDESDDLKWPLDFKYNYWRHSLLMLHRDGTFHYHLSGTIS